VLLVLYKNFSSHGDLSSLFNLTNNLLRQYLEKFLITEILYFSAHTNKIDSLSISNVVGDDLGKLWEVP